MARLAAPFPPDVVSWRPGSLTKDKKKAQALAYIDARDVQHRLDDVFGLGWETEHYNAGDDHICCRITVTLPDGRKISRTNGCWVGNVEVTPTKDGRVEANEEDRADREAKWALSDAFKRAATLFGIGKYLYDMPSPYMPINEFKRFDDETAEKLKRIAAKPFNEWQAARKERAAQRDQREKDRHAEEARRPPSEPRGADGLSDDARQFRKEVLTKLAEPTPPPADEGPREGELPIDTFERRFKSVTKDDFPGLVAHTKELFERGSEEHRRLASAIGDAAKRLGIEPKRKPAPPQGG